MFPLQVMELKNKCDAVEKRETEKRQLEEKKHQEELQALKKTNQQLKVRERLTRLIPYHKCLLANHIPISEEGIAGHILSLGLWTCTL